jgi:peptidoglycan L-alanyl-D-glutamate endopeptidase CwlK
MPSFSPRSLANLDTCHEDLQQVFISVVQRFDCTVLCGHRGEEAQNEAHRTGKSQLKYPQGNHNKFPSSAVDVAPYPIDWENRERFVYFGGYVLGVAANMDIGLRWGGDWSMDHDLTDQTFHDLPHFELV